MYYYGYKITGLVDQDALLEALQNKTIAGAGLDVMVPEPLPPDHPLLKLDNAGIINTHAPNECAMRSFLLLAVFSHLPLEKITKL